MKRLIILIGSLFAANAIAGGYIGDYAPGDTIDCNFGTVRPSTGASFTLAGTPAISVYKDNGTTESTAGVTLSADFDTRTGLNHVRVTTASDGTFYSAGSYFEAVVTTGTVDSVSVVGQPVCSFTLRKAYSLISSGTGTGQLSVSGGVIASNVTQFNGAAATSSGGRPEVNTTHWGGAAVASARPLVDTVLISNDAAAADRLEAILDGTCGAYPELGISRGVGCTALAYTAGTPSITLDASAAFGDNTLRGAIIMICGSTQGYCQPAVAASNVGSSDIVTLEQALPVTPTGTITFTIYAVPASSGVDVKKINGSSVCGTGASGDLWTKCP